MNSALTSPSADLTLSEYIQVTTGHLPQAPHPLTSSTRTASAVVTSNRRPSLKLVLVFAAAMVLVTLPVIPMRLYGVGFSPLKQLAALFPHSADKTAGLMTASEDTDAKQATSASLKHEEELTSLDSAAQKLAAGIASHPNDPSLHNQLGLIYEGLGDTEKAISQFQASVELSRSGLLALSSAQKTFREQSAQDKLSSSMIQTAKLSTDLSAAHSALARIYDQLGLRDKVVAELDLLNRDRAFSSVVAQKAVEKSASGTQVSVHRLSPACLQLLARAQAMAQARRTPEAIQLYKEALTLDPQAAIAHQQLGLAAVSAGNFYLAKEELTRASELDPSNAANFISLGMAYKGMSQFDMSRSAFQKAVSLDPKNYTALFQLGAIYAASGKNDLAAQMFQRVVDLNPASAAAHNNLGSSLSMAGHSREAITEFEKALSIAPDLASSHYGMGLALYNVKDYPAAVSELKRAVALNPGYSDAKEKIALCYRRTNSGTMGGAGFN